MRATVRWMRNLDFEFLSNLQPYHGQEETDQHKGLSSPMLFGSVRRTPTQDEVDDALRKGKAETLARLAMTPDYNLFGFTQEVVRRARVIFNYALNTMAKHNRQQQSRKRREIVISSSDEDITREPEQPPPPPRSRPRSATPVTTGAASQPCALVVHVGTYCKSTSCCSSMCRRFC